VAGKKSWFERFMKKGGRCVSTSLFYTSSSGAYIMGCHRHRHPWEESLQQRLQL